MNTNQKDQFGQGSRNDNNKSQNSGRDSESKNSTQQTSSRNPATSDDDFLSGDNASKSMSPGRGSNPNIGGNESEYESSTSSEGDNYDEASLADNEQPMNRRDSEETDRHDEETRYSSPSSRNASDE